VADAISILTQRMKGPFALRRFFWFRADPIAERKGGQMTERYFGYFDDKKDLVDRRSPKLFFFFFFFFFFFSLLSSASFSIVRNRRVFA
jgi:hypothetical protein